MKAAVMRIYSEPLTIEEIDIDGPKAGEIKVKLLATALCHTDASAWHCVVPVPVPIVLGHEGVGDVVEVGEQVTTVKPGDRVVLTACCYCGHCRACSRGLFSACARLMEVDFSGMMKDGTSRLRKGDETIFHFFCQSSFAEYAIAHEEFVVKVPKDVPLEVLAPLGCGASTGLGAAINKAKVELGDKVAVFGCGGVGLSAIMGAKVAGASMIFAVDILDYKLEAAKECGATHTINAAKENALERIQLTSEGGVDHSIDAVGTEDSLVTSLSVLVPGGSAVVVGFAAPTVTIDCLTLFLERSIGGCILGSIKPHYDIPRFIQLYKDGRLPLDKLITATYSLDQINQAIADHEAGKFIKAIIKF